MIRVLMDGQASVGTPGEVLQRLFMDPLGLSAYRLAKEMSVPPIAISEILRGKRAISAIMACRLGVYFGVDAHFWLALQSLCELRIARANGAGHGVDRCDELQGRSFVVREVAAPDAGPGARRWQVLIVKEGQRPVFTRQVQTVEIRAEVLAATAKAAEPEPSLAPAIAASANRSKKSPQLVRASRPGSNGSNGRTG